MATGLNEDHGPEAVGPSCFSMPMAGLASLTTRVALALFPVPPFVAEIVPAVLFLVPAAVPLTVTLKVQLASAAREPPLSAMVDGAVVVTVPPHWEEDPPMTSTPAGRLSLKAMPVRVVVELGLVTVKLSVVDAEVRIGVAANAMEMLGGARTVSESVPYPPALLFGLLSLESM